MCGWPWAWPRSPVLQKLRALCPCLWPPFPRPPSVQVLLSTGLSLLPGKCYSRLAWGPEGLIAAACGSVLHFLDSRTGEVVDRVDDAHEAAVSYFYSNSCYCASCWA